MNGEDPGLARLEVTERWFLKRGIPHFIAEYRARTDIFTRTLPFLLVVFVAELLGAGRADWRWWQILVGFVGAVALAVAAWAGLNLLRRRPAWQRPDTIGPFELGFFVLVPGLIRWIVSSRLGIASALVAANLVLLGLVYLVTSYGLVPMVRWAFGFMLRQLGAVVGLFGRAMPLLLLFAIALFINTEVWQVATTLDGWLFWLTIVFFVLIGTAFLLLRLPSELTNIHDEVDAEDPADRCRNTPMADVAAPGDDGEVAPLTRRQQGNLLLVLFFSQAVQVLLVTVSLTAFFLGFGLIAIRPATIAAWLGDVVDPGVIANWTIFGKQIVLTRALVHVAGLLGTLSGFYFLIYVITDATYREAFFTEIAEEVRQSLAVRRVYLAERRRLGAD